MNSKEKSKYRTTGKWKVFRLFLLKKHGDTCQVCGIQKKGKLKRYLQVHHLDPSVYGNEKEADVILLCSVCHKLVENFLSRKSFNIEHFIKHFRKAYLISKQYQDKEKNATTG